MLCTSPQLHFKLNAIHGHATWKHQSPFPLKIKIEKKMLLPNRPIRWRTLYIMELAPVGSSDIARLSTILVR